MVGVLDIDITYGLNLAPSGFRKVCANDGAPRALHTTKDGQTSSYLWYSLATGFNEKCITDMLVIYDDETAPHGFDIFPKNITKGSNHRTFIAIARNPKHAPICAIKIFLSEESTEHLELVPRSLSRDASVCLGFARASSSAAPESVFRTVSPPLPSKGLLDGTAIAHMHASVEEADESAWTDTLLPFVAMLMSEEADPALLSIANAFLQRVIEAVCAQLRSSEPVCESMVAALECVLGAKASCWKYYESYSRAVVEERQIALLLDGEFAKVPRTTADEVSRLYVTNLNLFGSLKGFESMLHRICAPAGSTAPNVSLGAVLAMVRIVRSIRVPRTRFSRSFLPLLQTAVFKRAAALSDEDLEELHSEILRERVGRESTLVERILSELQPVIKNALQHATAWEDGTVGKLLLNMAKQFIACAYLNLRIRGMAHIADVVVLEGVKDTQKPASSSSLFKLASEGLGRRQSGDFSDWLMTSDALAIMLGEESAMKRYELADNHVEVLKRSEPILMYLADKNKLKESVFDLLCNNASKDRPDLHSRQALKIIAALSHKLDLVSLRLMHQRVTRLAAQGSDDSFVDVFKNMSIAVLNLGSLEEDLGVGLLWEWAQSRQLAQMALAEILALASANYHLKELLGKSVCNIISSDRVRSLSMINFLSTVIQAQSSSAQYHSKTEAVREVTLVYAEKTLKLVACVLDELTYAVQAHVKDSAPGCSLDNIYTRLEFISFVLKNSSLQLSYPSMESVWILFNLTHSVPLIELVLHWYTALLPGEMRAAHTCISDDTAGTFFDKVMRTDAKDAKDVTPGLAMNFNILELRGYTCVENYFRFVNGKNSTISHCLNKQWFVVENDSVLGLSCLFRCLIDSSDLLVARAASEFLISLQSHISPSIDKFKCWSSFVGKCMTIVLKFVDMWSDRMPAIEIKLCRVLQLLVSFFDCIKKPAQMHVMDSSHDNVLRITATLQRPDAANYYESSSSSAAKTLVYVVKRKGITMGAIRSKIALDLGQDVERVRIIYQNSVYPLQNDAEMPDRISLQLFIDLMILDLAEDSDFEYIPQRPCRSIDEEPDSDQMRVRLMLASHPTYFKSLYDILKLKDSSVAPLAWSLLECIPINPAMADDLKSLEHMKNAASVDWSLLLDSSQPFHLLYRLRIITTIVSCIRDPFTDKEEKASATSWYIQFLNAHGLPYVVKLFVNTVLVVTSSDFPLQMQIVMSMLQLIDLYLSFRSTQSRGDDSPSPDEMCVDEVGVDDAADTVSQAATEDDDDDENASSMDIDEPRPDPPLSPAILRDQELFFDVYHEADLVWNAFASKLLYVLDAVCFAAVKDAENGRKSIALYERTALSAVEIFVRLAATQPSVLLSLLNDAALESTLVNCLIQRTSCAFRLAVSRGVQALCNQISSEDDLTAASLVKILLPHFQDVDSQDFDDCCSEYFELMVVLVKFPGALTSVEVYDVLLRLASGIKEREHVETSEDDDDALLQGYLSLLRALLIALPIDERKESIVVIQTTTELLDELCRNCLFPISDLTSAQGLVLPKPKCKSSDSRVYAFNLVLEMVEYVPEYYVYVLNFLLQLYTFKDFDMTLSSGFLSSKYLMAKSKIGYAGLDNPGCVCYMNSSLQQFFMVPAFRAGILELNEREFDSSVDPADNVLLQLQLLFGYLQYGEMASISTRDFSFSLKDFDGQPTDMLIQQDASEFLTRFFQQAEERLMGSTKEHLLKDCFGGVFSNQLVAEGGRNSSRDEPFYFISVEVGSGKSCLEESLAEFVKGESVDYSWDKADGAGNVHKESLPTIKKTLIKILPPHLIFHLRRFDFDYETGQLAKKNDRFEFPLSLDMFPYTCEGVAGEEAAKKCTYELSGIVVHIGTAESGHYYSYCRERTEAGFVWYEFNDSVVREFDVADIDEEAFGGPILPNSQSTMNPIFAAEVSLKKTSMKIKNAFMLFYSAADAHSTISPTPAPAKLRQMVQMMNLRFWKSKSLYNSEFFDFMTDFLSYRFPDIDFYTPDLFKCAFVFFLVILAQSDDREKLYSWSCKIATICRGSAVLSAWVLKVILQSDQSYVFERVIVREASHVDVMRVFVNALECVAYVEGDEHCKMLKALSFGFSYGVINLCDQIISHYKLGLHRTLSQLPYFFFPLFSLSRVYPQTALVLLQKGVLTNLLSLFSTDVKYNADEDSPDDQAFISTSIQVGLVCAMASSLSQIRTHLNEGSSGSDVHLVDISALLSSSAFPISILNQLRAISGVKFKGSRQFILNQLLQIVAFAVFESQDITMIYLSSLLESIEKSDGYDVKDGFRLAKLLIEVEDSMRMWRVDCVLCKLLACIESNSRYLQATEVSIDMLLRIFKTVPLARSWLQVNANVSRTEWLETWLENRRRGTVAIGVISTKPTVYGQRPLRPLHVITNKRAELLSFNGFQYAAAMASALKAFKSSVELDNNSYDSDDDGSTLVGKRVEIKWALNRFYAGVVDEFYAFDTEMDSGMRDINAIEENFLGEHRVVYDDGDVKQHLMSTKIWRFI